MPHIDAKASEEQAAAEADDRPIWEIIVDQMKDVPPEDFAALPRDGASQVDHLHLRLAQERLVQEVLADTFYWVALTGTHDLIHQQALSLSRTLGSPACHN